MTSNPQGATVRGMEKTFTVEEANRTLPLVRRIVEDLVRDHHLWEEKVREFEIATAASSPERPDVIAELNDLGVICKGMDTGLVDFRGQIDGRDVFYCWKLGEPSVQYWHEVDAGFVGRQRLHPLVLTSNSAN